MASLVGCDMTHSLLIDLNSTSYADIVLYFSFSSDSIWFGFFSFCGLIYKAHYLDFVMVFAVISGRLGSCSPPFSFYVTEFGFFKLTFFFYIYKIML